MSRRQIKSFSVQQFFKNAAEVWASSPHLRSKLDFAICFSCCNCIFWNCSIQTKLHHENQGCKFEQGNGAIAARWQAKAGVEPPFAGRWRPFSLKAVFALFPCEILLLGKPTAYGSAKSLFSLPLCCSPVVALSELSMNLFIRFRFFWIFYAFRMANSIYLLLLDFNTI